MEIIAPNQWLNLTAGAVRFFEVLKPASSILVNQSLCYAILRHILKAHIKGTY